jgi:putative peptidoglycan lipid II flippase
MTEVEAEASSAGSGERDGAAGASLAGLARAGAIVGAAFFASRVLGWVRTVVLAAVFGGSAALDDYFQAFRIPDLVFQLVAAGALGAALIPVLSGLFAHGEEARAWRVVSTVTTLMLGAVLALAVLAFVLAPWLVPLITVGFGPTDVARTVDLTRLMLLSPIFLAAGAIASSSLNALGRFTAAAVAPLLYNLAIIAAAIFLAPLMGVEALAVGVAVGAILNAVVQLPQLVRRPGFHFRLGADLRDPAAREVLLLLVPRAFGLGVTQVTFLVNSTLATGLGTAAVTIYNLAFTALQIPLGVLGLPLGVVLLPSLSRAAAVGARAEFMALTVRSMRLLLYLLLCVTALAMALSREATTLLYDYGNFGGQDVVRTADALFVFLVGLAGHGLIVVLVRAFYADRDTRTPVLAAVLSVGVNVIVSVLTVGPLGLAGLALGIAAGAWFEAFFLLLILARRVSGLDLAALGRAALAFAIGSAAAGVVAAIVRILLTGAWGTSPGKPLLLAELILASAAGGLVYVAYSRWLRLPELEGSLALVRAALRRRPSAS